MFGKSCCLSSKYLLRVRCCVVGSLKSKQNAGLSEQQQGYLFKTNVINSA